MIIWCFLSLSINYYTEMGGVETALKGKVIKESESSYLVDFSEYAKLQGYTGLNFSNRLVQKDDCVKE
jgi:hypothetical protein